MNRLAALLTGRTKIALVAGGIMWVIWAVGCALGTGNLDVTGQVIGADHTAFHTAAVLIADGEGAALYDFPNLSAFRARQEQITGKPRFLNPFRNPPFYALIYVPTARLPHLASYAIWAVVGLFSLVGGLRLIHGPGVGRPLAWSLSFFPVFAAVSFGQNTLLSFGVFAVVFWLLAGGRRFPAGLAAGLLLFKPQLLLGLGLWWALDVRRYWPCVAGVAVTGAALAGVSWLILPHETAAWLRQLPEIARYDAFEFYNLQNPRGFGALLTGDKAVGNWLGLIGLVLGVVFFARVWRQHRDDLPVLFAAAVFVTLWASPHTMTYEWALAVIPAVLLWDSRPDQRPTWLVLFAIAWVALFLSAPLSKVQMQAIGVAVQVSVPVMAFVGLRASRSLRA
jgi:alpha-1,2-mannosyltransferase